MLRIQKEEVISVLSDKLKKFKFSEQKAHKIAETFTQNSLEGVYSHGINRFPRFIEYTIQGVVRPDASPRIKSKFNAVQQWDGNRGPGILNAFLATEAALHLSNHYGIGCVAMANTNHWMRGGTYGRAAAKNGYVFIGWTNTIANLPAWGAVDSRLGNNPLVIAVPGNPPIALDMAMSQYSYGKLEDKVVKNEKLPMPGGYDSDGELSNNPEAILDSGRPIPIGYWKGAGLSLLLDILATILSDGLSTSELSKQKIESGVSQVFICINPEHLNYKSSLTHLIQQIIKDYHYSQPAGQNQIVFPGERTPFIVSENEEKGIPIPKSVWDEVLSL